MSAPVRIESEAWDDLRFRTLARLLGMVDGDLALIKCGRLWSWQAEHYTPEAPTYVVDADTIDSALGVAGGAAAMVRAKLADEVPEGFRVRGAEGRIEWLWQRRQAAKAGGEATKRKRASKDEPPGSPVAQPSGEPNSSPLVIALVLDQGDQIQSAPVLPRDPTVGAPVLPAVPAPVPAPVLRVAQDLADRRRRLIGKAWQLAGEAFLRVQGSGIDPTAPNGWAGLPSASTAPMRNLAARLDEMLVGEQPDFARAEARIANRILVAEADARAFSIPTARYMTPARMWDPTSFSIAVDLSPEQAATPMHRGARAGPRGSAERAPTKRTPLQNLVDDIARREAAGET